MNNTEVIFKSQTQRPIPYRTYQIGQDGIHLGGTPIGGKFPWRSFKKVGREILRAWARDLVAKHDAVQMSAILRRWAKEWSGKHDVNGADPATAELSTLEHLLSRLRDQSVDRKVHFGQHNNERDGTVMFNLSEEMIEAVGYCLKKVIIKPQTDGHRFSLYRTMWDQLFREEDWNGKQSSSNLG